MLRAALRDLQWRRRRFLVAVLGAGLVFAVSLVGSGISQSFRVEIDRTIAFARADRWVIPSSASGPFTDIRLFPAAVAQQVATESGVQQASPLLFTRTVVRRPKPLDVNVFGVVPAGVGAPRPSKGAALRESGDALVDDTTGMHVGDQIVVAGRPFRVAGTLHGSTLFAGTPNVYLPLADVQALLLGGQPLASAVVTSGTPAALPADFQALTGGQAKADAMRPLKNSISTIDLVRLLLWLTAVTIMGGILYLTAVERTRDIAVFKATGSSTGSIALGVALQGVLLAAGATVVAWVVAIAIAPTFALRPEIPASAFVLMPVVAVVVALLSSLVAIRRAVTVEPALAFGG